MPKKKLVSPWFHFQPGAGHDYTVPLDKIRFSINHGEAMRGQEIYVELTDDQLLDLLGKGFTALRDHKFCLERHQEKEKNEKERRKVNKE